jgi:hypothetical protein
VLDLIMQHAAAAPFCSQARVHALCLFPPSRDGRLHNSLHILEEGFNLRGHSVWVACGICAVSRDEEACAGQDLQEV